MFQGQEFGATSPFLFFSEAGDEKLHQAIAKGRLEFVAQFPSAANSEVQKRIPRPSDINTFQKCRLDWAERKTNASIHQLHRDLIRLRHGDSRLSLQIPGAVDGAVLGDECLVLRFFADKNNDRLLVINLGCRFDLQPCSEPLLAPPLDHKWELLWSSDHPDYGGPGVVEIDTDQQWLLPAEAAFVLKPRQRTEPRPKPIAR